MYRIERVKWCLIFLLYIHSNIRSLLQIEAEVLVLDFKFIIVGGHAIHLGWWWILSLSMFISRSFVFGRDLFELGFISDSQRFLMLLIVWLFNLLYCWFIWFEHLLLLLNLLYNICNNVIFFLYFWSQLFEVSTFFGVPWILFSFEYGLFSIRFFLNLV